MTTKEDADFKRTISRRTSYHLEARNVKLHGARIVLAACGGFAYVALQVARYFDLARNTLPFRVWPGRGRLEVGAILYLILLLASTLVFIGHGRLRVNDS